MFTQCDWLRRVFDESKPSAVTSLLHIEHCLMCCRNASRAPRRAGVKVAALSNRLPSAQSDTHIDLLISGEENSIARFLSILNEENTPVADSPYRRDGRFPVGCFSILTFGWLQFAGGGPGRLFSRLYCSGVRVRKQAL